MSRYDAEPNTAAEYAGREAFAPGPAPFLPTTDQSGGRNVTDNSRSGHPKGGFTRRGNLTFFVPTIAGQAAIQPKHLQRGKGTTAILRTLPHWVSFSAHMYRMFHLLPKQLPIGATCRQEQTQGPPLQLGKGLHQIIRPETPHRRVHTGSGASMPSVRR